ncbi:MAG: UDP-3-O-acyl-N-acetylglucosamine deacetylase [Alphaproteobacteria bacterium]
MTVPSYQQQQTLLSQITCTGIGVHSGKEVQVRLAPALEYEGVRFVLGRGEHAVEVQANWRAVVDTRLCTTLGHATGAKISTVEHLMAALAGCGVDNTKIFVEGEELPILDGSSLGFVEAIQKVGLRRQPAVRQAFRVRKPVRVQEGKAFLEITPSPYFEASLEVPLKGAKTQFFHYTSKTHDFETVASARTFSLLEQVQQMQAAGFIKGGGLENAVVLDGETVLNPEGLRFPDECARHKVLDMIGDLALAGRPILGHVRGIYPGHHLNHLLLQKLMLDVDAWELVPLPALGGIKDFSKKSAFRVATAQPVAVFETSAYNR